MVVRCVYTCMIRLLAITCFFLSGCAVISYTDGRKAKVYFPMEYAADGTIRPNQYAVDKAFDTLTKASPYLIDKAVEAMQKESSK